MCTIHRFQKFHIYSLSIENRTQMALECDNIVKFPIVFQKVIKKPKKSRTCRKMYYEKVRYFVLEKKMFYKIKVCNFIYLLKFVELLDTLQHCINAIYQHET